MRFKNKPYTKVRTIPTNIAADYVPDWTMYHAVRESIQNMVDEKTLQGVAIHWQEEENGVYFYDRGRGADFNSILYLGVSGKRGVEGVVGQHGEGELVSFLVAAREGVTKYMAAHNWLATGRIEEIDGHEVLVIDVYETSHPRRGTAWFYEGPEMYEVFLQGLDQFKQAKTRARYTRIDLEAAPGQLFTRGMKVNVVEDLALSYDLDITPGRDRGGFTLEQAKQEVIKILNEECKREHIVELLRRKMSTWRTPKEFTWDLQLDPNEVRLAAKDLIDKHASYKKEVVWADPRFTPDNIIYDADHKGYYVLRIENAPNWIKALRYVGEIVQQERDAYKDPPKALQEAADLLKELLPSESDWELKVVWEFDQSDTGALSDRRGDENLVILSRKHVKEQTFQGWVQDMIHELAHISTGASDCSRAHADGMGWIGAALVDASVESPKTYKKMKRLVERYQK